MEEMTNNIDWECYLKCLRYCVRLPDELAEMITTMRKGVKNHYEHEILTMKGMDSYRKIFPDGKQQIDRKIYHRFYSHRLFNNSMFVIIYAHFEDIMNDLADAVYSDILEKNNDFETRYTDLSGNGIEQSTKYITDYSKKNIHKDKHEWCEIKLNSLLRNSIIHNGNEVNEKIKKHSNFVKHVENEKITIYSKFQENFIINDNYIDFMLSNMKKYFEKLLEFELKNTEPILKLKTDSGDCNFVK